jgi:hypothetical protein
MVIFAIAAAMHFEVETPFCLNYHVVPALPGSGVMRIIVYAFTATSCVRRGSLS